MDKNYISKTLDVLEQKLAHARETRDAALVADALGVLDNMSGDYCVSPSDLEDAYHLARKRLNVLYQNAKAADAALFPQASEQVPAGDFGKVEDELVDMVGDLAERLKLEQRHRCIRDSYRAISEEVSRDRLAAAEMRSERLAELRANLNLSLLGR